MGVAGIVAATLGLSGCMGSPTYGTGTPAMEQLGDDLTSAISLGGQDDKPPVKYNPRPSLVVAKDTNLPVPQRSMAGRENNPAWVESPEETRTRLRDEATANENNPRYRSPLLAGKGQAGQMTESQKWEAFRQAKAQAEVSPMEGQRRSLSDPPAEFRSVDAAQLTDLGEPEVQKERRRKKEASEASKTSSWWKPFQ